MPRLLCPFFQPEMPLVASCLVTPLMSIGPNPSVGGIWRWRKEVPIQRSVICSFGLDVEFTYKNGGDDVNLVSTSYSIGASNRVQTGELRAGQKGKPCLGTKCLTAWGSQWVPSRKQTVRIH